MTTPPARERRLNWPVIIYFLVLCGCAALRRLDRIAR